MASGAWEQLPGRRRTAVRGSPSAVPTSRAHDAAVLSGLERTGSVEDAAVAAIAAAAGLAGARVSGPPEELVESTGSAAWACRWSRTSYEARIEGTAVSRASLTALWAAMPT